MRTLMRTSIAAVLAIFTLSAQAAPAPTESLVVFNSKEGSDISQIFKNFQAATGIPVRVIDGTQGDFVQRIKNGETADIMIVNDTINFSALTKEGLFQPVESDALKKAIPAHFREPQNRWFALSYKARVIMYDSRQVDPSELSTYEDLADPKWNASLCLRNSQKTYNKALVASLIVHHGLDGARQIVRGWVSNLARPPIDGDANVLQAMVLKYCYVGITNTYYLGRALAADPSFPIRAFFPNQGEGERGAHVNVAGMALLKTSKNQALARQLMDFMAADESQRLFADSNFEYPVNPSVKPGTLIADWGSFKIDTTNVSIFGDLSELGGQLSISAGY